VNTPNITTAEAACNGAHDLVDDVREMHFLVKELKRACEFEESEMDYLVASDIEYLDATWCRLTRKINSLISLILSNPTGARS
jgi:hypothetical protein